MPTLGPMMSFLVRLRMCHALSCLADTVLVAEFVHGGECDQK